MKKLIGDIKHILWLAQVCEISWSKFDIKNAREAILWVKIHLTYKSTKVNGKGKI